MIRPVRPVALYVLTLCALYPGLTFAYQGVYPFWTQETFTLVGQPGPWVGLAQTLGIHSAVAPVLKLLVGLAWMGGVAGLWAGDWRAYPLALLAAAGSLLYPWGPSVMGAIGLVCLVAFRERADTVPA
jgi:hypothetical protein